MLMALDLLTKYVKMEWGETLPTQETSKSPLDVEPSSPRLRLTKDSQKDLFGNFLKL